MDGYRDLHLVPARYYASSRYPPVHGVEGRSSYSLEPLYPAYSRAALDPYAGYGAPVSYHPELPYPQFLSPRRRGNPKRRPPPQSNSKRRPAPVESLTPRKKPFKKTQKVVHVDNVSLKGNLRKRNSQAKPPKKEQKAAAKPQKSLAATLVKETEELHKLFRTGVDTVKIIGFPGKNTAANGVGQKRKADGQKKGPPSRKKSKGKRKRSAKEKKQEAKKDEKPVEAPKAVKAEPAPLTEEEKKQMELALELQIAACKVVTEFLGIPEKSAEPEPEPEPEPEAVAEKSEATHPVGDAAQKEIPANEAQDNPEEVPKPPPALTPEEEKELEEKGFNFFSKMLEENSDLRKLYVDNKDAGTFECLVCHSIDPETSKKFTSLTSLVMHTSMRKQNRPEHRGYGKALCDILGWESLRPRYPAKQAKVDEEKTEAEKAVGETEEKQQEGTGDSK